VLQNGTCVTTRKSIRLDHCKRSVAHFRLI
jgi:hypothetical protein